MSGDGERGEMERCKKKTSMKNGEPAQREPRPAWMKRMLGRKTQDNPQSYDLWMTWIWCPHSPPTPSHHTHTQTHFSVPISDVKIATLSPSHCSNKRYFYYVRLQKVIEGSACRELWLSFFRGHLEVAGMWHKHTHTHTDCSHIYFSERGISCCLTPLTETIACVKVHEWVEISFSWSKR